MILPFSLMLLAAAAPSTPGGDPVQAALTRCLDAPANGSTAGQTDCYAIAARAYDKRMNRAYAALMQQLPVAARETLRRAQRAWLAFRDAESVARGALYATRTGTIYVPMEASSAVTVTRDRTLQLEGALRVLSIDR